MLFLDWHQIGNGNSREYSMENIAAIIAQSRDVKGIEGSRLGHFQGFPIISWNIIQASRAECIGKVFVTSYDSCIIEMATQLGASAIRVPRELSEKSSSAEDQARYVLEEAERTSEESLEVVVVLNSVFPVADSADIDAGVELLKKTGADSVFSAARVDDHPFWIEKGNEAIEASITESQGNPRAGQNHLFLETGLMYIFRTETFRVHGRLKAGRKVIYETPLWKSPQAPPGMWNWQTNADERNGGFLAGETSDSMERVFPRDIQLVVFDFDGVMTDNRALVREDGTEAVFVNRSDGLGVAMIKKMGIRQLILSTETNPVVLARAGKLGIETIAGCTDKKAALKDYCKGKGIPLEKVLYVGNDINDYEVMCSVGYPIVPMDAHARVRAIACRITRARGGEGVVKEIAEWLLVNSEVQNS
jgi:N-acylneuraminate cytidylyltransferase